MYSYFVIFLAAGFFSVGESFSFTPLIGDSLFLSREIDDLIGNEGLRRIGDATYGDTLFDIGCFCNFYFSFDLLVLCRTFSKFIAEFLLTGLSFSFSAYFYLNEFTTFWLNYGFDSCLLGDPSILTLTNGVRSDNLA